MSGGGKQQEGGSNSEMTAFIVVVVIGLALGCLWFFARPVVLYPAFALDYISITVIQIIKGLGPNGQLAKDFVTAIFDGRRNPYDGVSFSEFYAVRSLVGQQTRIFIVGIIALLAGIVIFRMKGQGFNRRFTLSGGKGKGMGINLYQAQRWKVATCSANFDPDGRDSGILPPKTPAEWLRDNNIEYENSTLDRDAAEKAFVKQLGKPWKGLMKADLPHQAVAILCGLHFLRRKESLSERETLNIACAGRQDGKKAMEALVEKYLGSGPKPKDEKLAKAIESIMGKHAFIYTGLFSLLDKARARSGVLPSSDFLWLRWVERDLHYAMNNVGRKKFHIEGAAVVNHYFSEHILGHPIPEPRVEEAINGIEDYFDEQGIESLKLFFEQNVEE